MEVRAKTEKTRRLLQAAVDGDVDYIDSVRTSCQRNGEDGDELLRTAVCTSGCTILHWAAGSNQTAVLEYLLVQNTTIFSTPDVPVTASKKSWGRTPLHYSCRNGHLEATRWLVQRMGANALARARHGVTPFQLAVWQNRLDVCRWLVDGDGDIDSGDNGEGEDDGRGRGWVDPATDLNDFDCGAVHWLGICPVDRANFNSRSVGTRNGDDAETDANSDGGPGEYNDGRDLLPLAKWLASQPGIDFGLRQRQGHTPLHKASWGGHLALVRYLHDEHDLWDDVTDQAGNYAASLADMANTPRHRVVAEYLRRECGRARAESCAILGVHVSADRDAIRRAYLALARQLHPDRSLLRPPDDDDSGGPFNQEGNDNPVRAIREGHTFDSLHKAYIHLMEQDGRGDQSNPAHSLNLMLRVSVANDSLAATARTNPSSDGNETGEGADENDESCFKARLVAVLLEYGDKGIDLSNVKKKWNQVWPDVPFPDPNDGNDTATRNRQTKKSSLKTMLIDRAGDVIRFDRDGRGGLLVFPKACSQASVAKAARELDNQ